VEGMRNVSRFMVTQTPRLSTGIVPATPPPFSAAC
jgi:hypothetical protein